MVTAIGGEGKPAGVRRPEPKAKSLLRIPARIKVAGGIDGEGAIDPPFVDGHGAIVGTNDDRLRPGCTTIWGRGELLNARAHVVSWHVAEWVFLEQYVNPTARFDEDRAAIRTAVGEARAHVIHSAPGLAVVTGLLHHDIDVSS